MLPPQFTQLRCRLRTRGDAVSLYCRGAVVGLLAALSIYLVSLLASVAPVESDGNPVWQPQWLAGWSARQRSLAIIGAAAASSFLAVAVMRSTCRRAHHLALQAAIGLMKDLYQQSFRLEGARHLPGFEEGGHNLDRRALDTLRVGLYRWWSSVPISTGVLITTAGLVLLTDVWLGLLVVLTVITAGLVISRLYRPTAPPPDSQVEQARAHWEELQDGLATCHLVVGFEVNQPQGIVDDTLQGLQAAVAAAERRSVGRTALAFGVALLGLWLIAMVVSVSPRSSVYANVVLSAAAVTAGLSLLWLLRFSSGTEQFEQAAAEIANYLDRDPKVSDVASATPLERLEFSLDFDAVTLGHRDGTRLLDRASFRVPAGASAAIVAADRRVTHAVAGLLMRLYDPAAGRVLFDGKDVSQVTLASLRAQACLVAGEHFLFPGTISDNISCGDAAYTKLEITDAAKMARAFRFIQRLPEGFGTVVGTHGASLTLGQAFRIALARALLRQPALLVLEEPDQPIDPDSESPLGEAIRRAANQRTLVLLPRSADTLSLVDQVFFFQHGKLLASGSHEQLQEECPGYRHWALASAGATE